MSDWEGLNDWVWMHKITAEIVITHHWVAAYSLGYILLGEL